MSKHTRGTTKDANRRRERHLRRSGEAARSRDLRSRSRLGAGGAVVGGAAANKVAVCSRRVFTRSWVFSNLIHLPGVHDVRIKDELFQTTVDREIRESPCSPSAAARGGCQAHSGSSRP